MDKKVSASASLVYKNPTNHFNQPLPRQITVTHAAELSQQLAKNLTPLRNQTPSLDQPAPILSLTTANMWPPAIRQEIFHFLGTHEFNQIFDLEYLYQHVLLIVEEGDANQAYQMISSLLEEIDQWPATKYTRAAEFTLIINIIKKLNEKEIKNQINRDPTIIRRRRRFIFAIPKIINACKNFHEDFLYKKRQKILAPQKSLSLFKKQIKDLINEFETYSKLTTEGLKTLYPYLTKKHQILTREELTSLRRFYQDTLKQTKNINDEFDKF